MKPAPFIGFESIHATDDRICRMAQLIIVDATSGKRILVDRCFGKKNVERMKAAAEVVNAHVHDLVEHLCRALCDACADPVAFHPAKHEQSQYTNPDGGFGHARRTYPTSITPDGVHPDGFIVRRCAASPIRALGHLP